MSKKGKKKKQTRAEPRGNQAFLVTEAAYETLCCTGYTRLSQNPEIISAVNKICDLISSMTIHLMGNTEKGDVRIQNELSKKIDIEPCKWTTRKSFISAMVRAILLEGDGNCVVMPQTSGGILESLQILPPEMVAFISDGWGYKIQYGGISYSPDEALHFIINPEPSCPWKGTGYRVVLKDVAHNLKQAAETKKGFMESKWKPSIIVKVDSNADELSNKDGRKKILENYIESTEAGEPWLLPAEEFSVEQVKPLSLQDLALSDAVQLDKKTVAAILAVPGFVVGVGEFNAEEWNNFINTRIRALCNVIEQEMTKKLLLNPSWYFRFNVRSLYSYDIKTLSEVGDENYVRGIMAGNEVRDWLGLSPMDGLDERVILENYIPAGMIGQQKKLMQEGSEI